MTHGSLKVEEADLTCRYFLWPKGLVDGSEQHDEIEELLGLVVEHSSAEDQWWVANWLVREGDIVVVVPFLDDVAVLTDEQQRQEFLTKTSPRPE